MVGEKLTFFVNVLTENEIVYAVPAETHALNFFVFYHISNRKKCTGKIKIKDIGDGLGCMKFGIGSKKKK